MPHAAKTHAESRKAYCAGCGVKSKSNKKDPYCLITTGLEEQTHNFAHEAYDRTPGV